MNPRRTTSAGESGSRAQNNCPPACTYPTQTMSPTGGARTADRSTSAIGATRVGLTGRGVRPDRRRGGRHPGPGPPSRTPSTRGPDFVERMQGWLMTLERRRTRSRGPVQGGGERADHTGLATSGLSSPTVSQRRAPRGVPEEEPLAGRSTWPIAATAPTTVPQADSASMTWSAGDRLSTEHRSGVVSSTRCEAR